MEFLKSPEKFNTLGARIPHGVLLVGPPGTGKTLLARACAGEAGVPFYSISGSDFVEMYQAHRRDELTPANKNRRCSGMTGRRRFFFCSFFRYFQSSAATSSMLTEPFAPPGPDTV